MSLPPHLAGLQLVPGEKAVTTASTGAEGQPAKMHQVDLFLDYQCQFSARMFATVQKEVIPRIQQDTSLAGRVQFVFRPQIQPWHPGSLYMHETALAVAVAARSQAAAATQTGDGKTNNPDAVASDAFWRVSAALFENREAFDDVPVAAETLDKTYQRLQAVVAGVPGLAHLAEEVGKMLKLGENGGNAMTKDIKLVIRLGRGQAVHMSPTVLFDVGCCLRVDSTC